MRTVETPPTSEKANSDQVVRTFPDQFTMEMLLIDWKVRAVVTEPNYVDYGEFIVERKYVISDNDAALRMRLQNPEARAVYQLVLRNIPRNGRVSGVAEKVDRYIDLEELPDPRERIVVDIVVRDRKVVSNLIRDGGLDTIGLYVDGAVRTRSGQKVAIIKSRYFADAVWHAALPTSDGVFAISAILQPSATG